MKDDLHHENIGVLCYFNMHTIGLDLHDTAKLCRQAFELVSHDFCTNGICFKLSAVKVYKHVGTNTSI